MPAQVAQLVSEMLVAVTEGEGTGVEAAIPGFKVAGKTGTAQKIDPTTHRYSDTHYVASFTGFVPADKPKYAFAAVYEGEIGESTHGGTYAAPMIAEIMKQLFKPPPKAARVTHPHHKPSPPPQQETND